jgi:hypothetical protein
MNTVKNVIKGNKMKIKIYTDVEKTKAIYDMELADYLVIVNNELFKEHWQVIEFGDIVITRKPAE